MNKKILALSIALLGINAHAATLRDITERALAHNPEIQARMHSFLSGREDEDAGRSAWRPRIDLNAYAGRDYRDTPTAPSTSFNHPEISLQLRQLLFDAGAASSEIRRLGHTKTLRYFELLQTSDEVALETARANLDLQRYRQLARLAQENWAIHKETYDQLAEKVKAGVGRKVDLEQAAGRLALAQSNWLTETSNLHDVGARFERIVGSPAPLLDETPLVSDKLPNEKDVVLTSIRNNPIFLAAVSNLRAARAQTDVRRAANAPTIEFQASAAAARNRDGISGSYRDATARIVMIYTLYNGGGDSARIRSAQENYYAAKEQRERACRDVRQVVSIAWNDVRKLREQLRFLEQHALSTEKARDAYRQQFDIGQRSLLDVLDTENELFQARRALAGAQYDLKYAEFRVLGASHQLLTILDLSAPIKDFTADDAGEPAEDAALTCSTEMTVYEGLDYAGALAARPKKAEPAPEPKTLVASTEPALAKPLDPVIAGQCDATIKDWASAWSAGDLALYHKFYSADFKPESMSTADWKALRAKRLKKASISVQISDIKILETEQGRCSASFFQRYRSNDYNDDGAKLMELRKEGQNWRILREQFQLPKASANKARGKANK